MKKIWLIIPVILLLLIAGFIYAQLHAVQQLRVNVRGITIDDVTLSGMTLTFLVTIYNPNFIDVDVGSFTAVFSANDVYLTTITLPKQITILRGQIIEQQFSVKLTYLDIGKAILTALQENDVRWQLTGEYDLVFPFGITYPYTFTVTR